jgi:murein DD-endopeptidase MepM/ murein hydrolase activator NlpD
MGKYRFNREQLKFVEDKLGLKGWVLKAIKYFIISLLLAVLYYFVISFFFSTERERRIARENKMMTQEYKTLKAKMKVLDNTVLNLKERDREIYKNIFNAEPPALSQENTEEESFFSQIDTSNNERIIKYSSEMLSAVEKNTVMVDNSMKIITSELNKLGPSATNIPSIVPIRDFSIEQTGASIGNKVNPFYKTVRYHGGVDLLAATGTDVLAAADGVVMSQSKEDKGVGNSVVINHKNGYVTKYYYLGDLLVSRGQNVKQGNVIARVGISGMSFAPHLHYEVTFKGKQMDPVNYFFSDMTPQMLREMMIITVNTGQSLD